VRRVHRILRSPDPQVIGGKRAAVVTCGLMIAVSAGAGRFGPLPTALELCSTAQLAMQARSSQASGLQETNVREFKRLR